MKSNPHQIQEAPKEAFAGKLAALWPVTNGRELEWLITEAGRDLVFALRREAEP